MTPGRQLRIIRESSRDSNQRKSENPAQPKPTGQAAGQDQLQCAIRSMSTGLGRVERTLYRPILRLARSFDKEPALTVGNCA